MYGFNVPRQYRPSADERQNLLERWHAVNRDVPRSDETADFWAWADEWYWAISDRWAAYVAREERNKARRKAAIDAT